MGRSSLKRMYYWLKGIVEEKKNDCIILNVQGVGYQLMVKQEMLNAFPPVGELAKIYTYFNVREDVHELYAFISETQRQLFIQLISVSGIGPKVGLGMISTMEPEELAFAIISSNIKKLTTCPGIGKKTAERIILELKEKVDGFCNKTSVEFSETTVSLDIQNDAIQVLVALGYEVNVATQAIRQISPDHDTNTMVKLALKMISKEQF